MRQLVCLVLLWACVVAVRGATVTTCAVNNGGCHPFAACTDGGPGVNATCGVCPDGFAGDGFTCTDIDECAVNATLYCPDPSTTCFNTISSYECLGCPADWRWSPGAVPVTPIVNLTAATTYGIGARSFIDAVFTVVFNGDTAVYPGTFATGVTGMPGQIHRGDTTAQGVMAAVNQAYTQLQAMPCQFTIPEPSVADVMIAPGVYCFTAPTLTLGGHITLNGLQEPSPAYVLRVFGSLNVSARINMQVTNGSRPCDVFWTAGNVTFQSDSSGFSSTFIGTILSAGNVTELPVTRVIGRIFSLHSGLVANQNPGLVDMSYACARANCSFVHACATNNGGCGQRLCTETTSGNRTCTDCPAHIALNPATLRCDVCKNDSWCGAFRNCSVATNGTGVVCGRCLSGYASLSVPIGAGDCTFIDPCPTLSTASELPSAALVSPTTIDMGDGHSTLFGNLLVNASVAFVDLTSQVIGATHTADADAALALDETTELYTSLSNLLCTHTLSSAQLQGQTLSGGGVYCFAASPDVVSISGNQVLWINAAPTERVVIKAPKALVFGPGPRMAFGRSNVECELYWVAQNFTYAAVRNETQDQKAYGTVVTRGYVSMGSGAVLFGRILTISGPVHLNNSVIDARRVCNASVACVSGTASGCASGYTRTPAYVVSFGNASHTAVAAATTVSVNNGVTTIAGGDLVAHALTGSNAPPVMNGGVIHINDATYARALYSIKATRDALLALPCTTTFTSAQVQLGGLTLSPGVYCWTPGTTATVRVSTGDLLLNYGTDGLNKSFVFRVPRAYSQARDLTVTTTGDGRGACAVYWTIGSTASIGTNAVFTGAMIANSNVVISSGTVVRGRVYSTTSSVSLEHVTVSLNATCPGNCTDINECAVSNGGCDALVTCTNTPGSRACGACPAGYTGSETCVDINECLVNNGGCSQSPLRTCVNTPGNRTCGACPSGYVVSGYWGCADVDECATDNGGCGAHVHCTNTVGSYACGGCVDGYANVTSGGPCLDIDECAASLTPRALCGGFGTCNNTDGGYSCVCDSGYYLTAPHVCNKTTLCRPNNPCHNGGVCRLRNNGTRFHCLCTSDYTGTTCTERARQRVIVVDDDDDEDRYLPGPILPPPVPVCRPGVCANGGRCVETVPSPMAYDPRRPTFTCLCPTGWTGTRCETRNTSANDDDAFCVCVHGSCDNSKCACTPPWTGDHCDVKDVELICAAHGPCDNGGWCEPLDDEWVDAAAGGGGAAQTGWNAHCVCHTGTCGPDCQRKGVACESTHWWPPV